MTHAFFKALLFLGSGSVIHGTGTQDMREMGGAARSMPTTYRTYLIGYLALAGIPIFAGFWSKDAILDQAWIAGIPGFFWALVFGAFCTGFYMTRQMVMVFGGDAPRNPTIHAHESPPSMTVPLIVLAAAAVVAGFVGVPSRNVIKPYLETVLQPYQAEGHQAPSGHGEALAGSGHAEVGEAASAPTWLEGANLEASQVDLAVPAGHEGEHHGATIPGTGLNLVVTLLGTTAALAGLALGYAVYRPAAERSKLKAERYATAIGLDAHAAPGGHDHGHAQAGPTVDPAELWDEPLAGMPFYRVLENKYYFDEIYWAVIVQPVMALSRAAYAVDRWLVDLVVNFVGILGLLLSYVVQFTDKFIVDGVVNGVAGIVNWIGRGVRLAQTGRVQNYAVVLFLGALALVAAGLMGWGR
jgi:NADH-quinone oxidoreductase subunit L